MHNKTESDRKLYSAACERNQQGISEVLTRYFPEKSKILEVASGTGQHADFFSNLPANWIWQTSDIEENYLKSIKTYATESNNSHFLSPLVISTLDEDWSIAQYDGIFCSNMIHISPWDSCRGLFRLARHHLNKSSYLILYGPFFESGTTPAESNLEFDKYLNNLDSSFGIRFIHDVKDLATNQGFHLITKHEMAANNLCLVFKNGD